MYDVEMTFFSFSFLRWNQYTLNGTAFFYLTQGHREFFYIINPQTGEAFTPDQRKVGLLEVLLSLN